MQLSFTTDKQGLGDETLFRQGRQLTKALSLQLHKNYVPRGIRILLLPLEKRHGQLHHIFQVSYRIIKPKDYCAKIISQQFSLTEMLYFSYLAKRTKSKPLQGFHLLLWDCAWTTITEASNHSCSETELKHDSEAECKVKTKSYSPRDQAHIIPKTSS